MTEEKAMNKDTEAKNGLTFRKAFEVAALGVGICAGVMAVSAESAVPALVMAMSFAAAYGLKR